MADSRRWGIAAAGFLLQMALGAVYAWSVFRVPLSRQFHWNISEVTLTFTISIFVLGRLVANDLRLHDLLGHVQIDRRTFVRFDLGARVG